MKIKAIHRHHLLTLPLALGALLLASHSVLAEEKKGGLNSRDEAFVQHESAAGAATVKVGELGAMKAQSSDIKVFASLIVTEHTKLNTELKLLATNKGVEISTSTDPHEADAFQKLESASGPEFDKLFLAALESGHEKCMSNFEEASKNAQDSDLKAWVDKTLPVLKEHHNRINELSTNIIAKAPGEPHKMAGQGQPAGATLTAFDQGSSVYDTETTAKIRRELMANGNISITAQNVKIITSNGRVTLRGAVNTDAEKRAVEELAAKHVSPTHLDSHLEVTSSSRP